MDIVAFLSDFMMSPCNHPLPVFTPEWAIGLPSVSICHLKSRSEDNSQTIQASLMKLCM